MDSVNKTLYIPLAGKAYVSRRGLVLRDPKAEAIWAAAGFPLKGKAASKWLAYHMGIRAAVFDNWLASQLQEFPGATVLHLGCGLDSRCCRVTCENAWYDVDFPQVIRERQRYFRESERYRMIGADLREDWLEDIPSGGDAIIVMEGVSMYLSAAERQALLKRLRSHFSRVRLLLDAYTVFAAKATRFKNPINEVGVTLVHGFDDPRDLENGTRLIFRNEHELTPPDLIAGLPKGERFFFRTMFAGKTGRRFYRLYEYR